MFSFEPRNHSVNPWDSLPSGLCSSCYLSLACFSREINEWSATSLPPPCCEVTEAHVGNLPEGKDWKSDQSLHFYLFFSGLLGTPTENIFSFSCEISLCKEVLFVSRTSSCVPQFSILSCSWMLCLILKMFLPLQCFPLNKQSPPPPPPRSLS